MEDIVLAFLYAAACAGIHARKETFMGHTEMMYELYEWVLFKRPTRNWGPWSLDNPRAGWHCW